MADVMSAQTLGTNDAEELRSRLAAELATHNIVEAGKETLPRLPPKPWVDPYKCYCLKPTLDTADTPRNQRENWCTTCGKMHSWKTAQTFGTNDAEELRARVAAELETHNIVEAT